MRRLSSKPLILVLALALISPIRHCHASESIIGSRETCEVEGEDFTVDKIPNTRCFNCLCKNGFVECRKQQSPSIEGCYTLLEPREDECCHRCKGCTRNGVHHGSETEWIEGNDPCRIFACKAGVITESRLHCYTPCSDPIPPPPGQCCPVCAGCHVNGQMVTADRSVTTTEDPCVTCRCNGARLTCAKQACPVLHCLGSRIVHDPGECCPRCKAGDTCYRRKARAHLGPASTIPAINSIWTNAPVAPAPIRPCPACERLAPSTDRKSVV